MSGTAAFRKFVQHSSVILFRFSGYSETPPDGLEAFIVLVEVVGAVTHLEAHAAALGSGPGADCAYSSWPWGTGGGWSCRTRRCCPCRAAGRLIAGLEEAQRAHELVGLSGQLL